MRIKTLLFFAFSLVISSQAISYEKTRSSDPRIVGGSPAADGEYPSIARLVHNNGLTIKSCAGSLIDNEWIVSAAHCVKGLDLKYFTVTLGESDISKRDGYEQHFKVSKVIVHPNYNDRTFRDDIALLKLAGTASINNRVGLTKIGALPAVGSSLVVAGWGRTSFQGSTSNILLKTNVPLRSHKECQKAYEGVTSITNNQFCAGYVNGGHDACQGDSGGPIFLKEGGASLRQVGIVSGGKGCALPGFFGIYTNINNYKSWIQGSIAVKIPKGKQEIHNKYQIEMLYLGFFNREADARGLRYWKDRLKNGMRYEDIAYSFYQSPEFASKRNKSRREFIKMLYLNLFNRPPLSAGLRYWDESGVDKHLLIKVLFFGAQEKDHDTILKKLQ